MTIRVVNLAASFDQFSDHWNPRIVGALNGQHVKVAKLSGEFVAHTHDEEDEMFLVIEGSLQMELENETLQIEAGEFVIIPRGTQHKPIAREEVKVMLFEPATTRNTGALVNDFTVTDLERL